MALTDFFRINLPYGIKCNDKNEWTAFNREYMPLGSNNKSTSNLEHEVFTKYKRLTESAIEKIIKDKNYIQRSIEGKITKVFFYNDGTNPKNSPEYWNDYFKIIKELSKFEIANK